MRKRPSSLLVTAVLALLLIPAGVRLAHGKAVGPPEVAWKALTYEQRRRS